MTRAAVYCRISKDDEGQAAGVKRQERDGRQLATSKGWTVADVLVDNDMSAYNGRVRPGYDRLLAGLADGTFDAVVAWKYDRLSRTGVRGLAPLLDALDDRPLVCVHDSIDTSTPMGEGIAAMLASMAKQESANIGTRVRSHKAERAAQGLPSGGARAFGYEADGMTVRKDEARAYRKAARDVLERQEPRRRVPGVERRRAAHAAAGSTVVSDDRTVDARRTLAMPGCVSTRARSSARRRGPRSSTGRPTKLSSPSCARTATLRLVAGRS